MLLGSQIEAMTDEELRAQVEETNLFAKLNDAKNLKLLNCSAKGHTVGFMGMALMMHRHYEKLMWAFQ